jgi:hypothetical protein
MLHGRQHDVTHNFATMTTGCRRPAHRLSVAAIEREGHAQRFAIVATKLEAVRTPSLIAPRHRDFALMPAHNARPSGPSMQQQPIVSWAIEISMFAAACFCWERF